MIWENKHNLPDRIIRQVGTLHKPEPNRVSVTDLISCPRERHLLETSWDEIVLDYSDFLQTIIGISVHERQDRLSQKVATDDTERKYEDKVGLITVVGKADNYDTLEKCVRETKVKAVGALGYESFVEEVTRQLNVYAWQRRKRGFDVDKLELDCYYRDFKEFEVERSRPKIAVMKEGRKTALKLFETKEDAEWWILGKKKPGEKLYLEDRVGSDYPEIPVAHSVPIDLWTFEKQQEFVEEQVELFVLDPEYCGIECKWKNELKCRKYCNARSVCQFGDKNG